jgi:hypothetical protein
MQRPARHHRLALVHVIDDEEFGHAAVAKFHRHQVPGDDAENGRPRLQHRVGDGSHQADAAAAVDEPVSAGRNRRTEVSGSVVVALVSAAFRTAIDADVALLDHGMPSRKTKEPDLHAEIRLKCGGFLRPLF